MSILIKGMDMPKEGSFSILYVYGDGSIRMPAWGKGLVKAEYMQASELPPHGRLIDADEFSKKLWKAIEDDWNQKASPSSWASAMQEIDFWVENEKTIIEAEEEEK